MNTENANLSKYTISFGLSLALASVLNALLVVAKEKIPSVTAGLQSLTGHHWVSHGAIILVLFAAFGWIFAQPNAGQGIRITASRLTGLVVLGVVIGGLIISVFYLTAG
jgi:hypothetical protein